MKKKIIIPALVLSFGLGFSACSGDHSTRVEGDTVNYAGKHDNAALDSVAKQDSSKVTTKTGDAGALDNSGSGGTRIAKDSSKIKKP